MALYVQNKQDELVPDGEYTAKILKIQPTKTGDNLMFRCAITTEGFNNTTVLGFCGAHWRPSNRTTANLRQWCINLGLNVVKGQEEAIDLDELVGKDCRIIVQGYTGKDGMQRVKVSNILPFDKKPVNKPVLKSTGLHIGNNSIISDQNVSSAPVAPAPVPAPAPAPVAAPQAAAVEHVEVQQAAPAATSTEEDDLW